MRFKQLKLLYVAGFVVIVGLVVGGGYSWRSWGGEKEVISVGGGDESEDKEVIKESEKIEGSDGDWKVYKNEKYGYEIKLPQDWVYTNMVSRYPGKNVAFSDQPISRDKWGAILNETMISVNVWDNTTGLMGDDWLQKRMDDESKRDPSEGKLNIKNKITVSTDFGKGLKIEYEPQMFFETYFFSDDKIIGITTNDILNNEAISLGIYDKMIESLRKVTR